MIPGEKKYTSEIYCQKQMHNQEKSREEWKLCEGTVGEKRVNIWYLFDMAYSPTFFPSSRPLTLKYFQISMI